MTSASTVDLRFVDALAPEDARRLQRLGGRAHTGARFAGTFVAGALPFTERTLDHFRPNRRTFSPSGDRLVSTGGDRATVSWTLDPRQWRAAACRIAGRDLSEGEWRQYPARS